MAYNTKAHLCYVIPTRAAPTLCSKQFYEQSMAVAVLWVTYLVKRFSMYKIDI